MVIVLVMFPKRTIFLPSQVVFTCSSVVGRDYCRKMYFFFFFFLLDGDGFDDFDDEDG